MHDPRLEPMLVAIALAGSLKGRVMDERTMGSQMRLIMCNASATAGQTTLRRDPAIHNYGTLALILPRLMTLARTHYFNSCELMPLHFFLPTPQPEAHFFTFLMTAVS